MHDHWPLRIIHNAVWEYLKKKNLGNNMWKVFSFIANIFIIQWEINLQKNQLVKSETCSSKVHSQYTSDLGWHKK